MKNIILLVVCFVLTAFLCSCAGMLEAFNPINWFDDPEVRKGTAKAGLQVISGELYGAAYTVGSIALYQIGKWFRGRMLKSGPGEIIGSKG